MPLSVSDMHVTHTVAALAGSVFWVNGRTGTTFNKAAWGRVLWYFVKGLSLLC